MAVSVKDAFIAAWKTRFPDDLPPQIDFHVDEEESDEFVDKLNDALRKCTARIRELQNELHKEEFVATFLWDSIHGHHNKTASDTPRFTSDTSVAQNSAIRQRSSWYGDRKDTPWKKSSKKSFTPVTEFTDDGVIITNISEQNKPPTPDGYQYQQPDTVDGQTPYPWHDNPEGKSCDDTDNVQVMDAAQAEGSAVSITPNLPEATSNTVDMPHSIPEQVDSHTEVIPTVRQSIAFYNNPSSPIETHSPPIRVPSKKKIPPMTAPRPKARSRTQVVASDADTWHSGSFKEQRQNKVVMDPVRSVSLDHVPENKASQPSESSGGNLNTIVTDDYMTCTQQASSPTAKTSSFHPVYHHSPVSDNTSNPPSEYVSPTVSAMSTFKPPTPSPRHDNSADMSSPRNDSCVDTSSPRYDPLATSVPLMKVLPRQDVSFDSSLSSMKEERIYDEPFAVVKSEIAEESSDSSDEEPLYYNILLMKQHKMAMKKASFRYPEASSGADEGQVMTHDPSDGTACVDALNWKKRDSMQLATTGESEQSPAVIDELDMLVAPCPEAEKLQMRKWVISSILKSEHEYVSILGVLQQYMKTFKSVADTQLEQITVEDIDAIFFKIPELHEIHYKFINDLEPQMRNWTEDQQIAETFKLLAIQEYPIAAEYLKNYRQAVATLQRCCQHNTKFQNITEEISCHGIREKLSLEELLHKPVVRFQRNTLVLHDLINCTPTSHPDYDLLQKTLKIAQKFLEDIQGVISTDSTENNRYLAKQGLLVEKIGNKKKLRHLFLFQDIIVCANQQLSAKKVHYDCKWFIPLVDIEMDSCSKIEESHHTTESRQQHIRNLEQKVSELQHELKAHYMEQRRSIKSQYRNIDKVKRKLAEQESALMLAAPRLLFHLRDEKQKKTYTLLMSSDYERASWKDTLLGLQSRASRPAYISAVEIQNLINSQKLPPAHAIKTMIANDSYGMEEEYLFGCLNVTIHKLQALEQHCNSYCCVETDAFGHFCCKAKTSIAYNKVEPRWNEDFELDLEGAQTLRFLCYKTGPDSDILLGRCALELNKSWLSSGGFQEKTLSLGEKVLLTVSLKYVHRAQTIKRTRSEVKGGLFGVKISTITSRECLKVPLIVTSCINEVEGRGCDEIGIYRVSGQSAEIQKLKRAFERNSKAARALLCDVDINVVTSLLKLYFRELPEALFTDDLYPSLVEAISSPDSEAKNTRMFSLLQMLPEPNLSTIMALLKHMCRISDHESQNKMSLENLATVFGPTLLRPATKTAEETVTMDLFSAGARDALMQTSILHFFLSRYKKGLLPCM